MWITIALVVIAAIIYLLRQPGPAAPPDVTTPAIARAAADGGIARLFKEQQSDEWVEASGRIVKVLPDDKETDGGRNDRHQRLLVEVETGITVLVSHNIDAAPRVPASEGDTIKFRGEYEWTEKGGTIHFTHASKHANSSKGGWLEHKGKRYE